jgi:hypothetical protein
MTSYEQLVEAGRRRVAHLPPPRPEVLERIAALLAPALAELERNAEASARKP